MQAPTQQRLDEILNAISSHGAIVQDHDCRLQQADIAGAFPEGFYSSTNMRTQVRLDGHWMNVDDQEMDCGVIVEAVETCIEQLEYAIVGVPPL